MAPQIPPASGPRMVTQGYSMPYGQQQGQMMAMFSATDYQLPRANTQQRQYANINPHLQSQNTQYQTPYHLSHLPAQQHMPQGQPSAIASTPQASSTSKAKSTKAKTKTPKSKVSKPKQPRPSKPKQRPQSSKHLTPSLRAAIITLKVHNPNISFKEIGEILSIPDDDDDEDSNDAETEGQNQDHQDSSNVAHGNHSSNGTIDSTTDPNLQSLNPTAASLSVNEDSASNNPSSLKSKSSTNKSKAKGKVKSDRKAIPRNTVAGIFKRAVERAGTDSDLYRMLEQTGRRAGSGRPKKGEGKKDRDHAEGEGEGEAPLDITMPVSSAPPDWRSALESATGGMGMGLHDHDGGIGLEGIDMDGLDMDHGHDQGGWNSDDGRDGADDDDDGD